MKNGKYLLGAVMALCGTALSAYTGNSEYFSDAFIALLILGFLYRNH